MIVCNGSKDLKLSNGSLSKSLLEAAGDGLQEELDSSYPDGIDFGECAISKGYNLPCKSVYYGTLPKWEIECARSFLCKECHLFTLSSPL